LEVQALKLLRRQRHGRELALNAILLVNVLNVMLHVVRHLERAVRLRGLYLTKWRGAKANESLVKVGGS